MNVSSKSSLNFADNTTPETCRSQDSTELFKPSSSPSLDETWMATMMRNMQRMAVDDDYRQVVAQRLS